MSLKELRSIDSVFFGTVNRITITEYQDRTTVSIQKQGTGTVVYDLEDKEVYWEREGIKLTDACDGCLYKTTPSHCLRNQFIQRTLCAIFCNSCGCFFRQIQVIGEPLTVCEEMDRISLNHPICIELFTGLLQNTMDTTCCQYERKCVPRWQKGKIALVTTMYPLRLGIS